MDKCPLNCSRCFRVNTTIEYRSKHQTTITNFSLNEVTPKSFCLTFGGYVILDGDCRLLLIVGARR